MNNNIDTKPCNLCVVLVMNLKQRLKYTISRMEITCCDHISVVTENINLFQTCATTSANEFGHQTKALVINKTIKHTHQQIYTYKSKQIKLVSIDLKSF